jgi:hypothetical protein
MPVGDELTDQSSGDGIRHEERLMREKDQGQEGIGVAA